MWFANGHVSRTWVIHFIIMFTGVSLSLPLLSHVQLYSGLKVLFSQFRIVFWCSSFLTRAAGTKDKSKIVVNVARSVR